MNTLNQLSQKRPWGIHKALITCIFFVVSMFISYAPNIIPFNLCYQEDMGSYDKYPMAVRYFMYVFLSLCAGLGETFVCITLLIVLLRKFKVQDKWIICISIIFFGLGHFDLDCGVQSIPLVVCAMLVGTMFIFNYYMYLPNWKKAFFITAILHALLDFSTIVLSEEFNL